MVPPSIYSPSLTEMSFCSAWLHNIYCRLKYDHIIPSTSRFQKYYETYVLHPYWNGCHICMGVGGSITCPQVNCSQPHSLFPKDQVVTNTGLQCHGWPQQSLLLFAGQRPQCKPPTGTLMLLYESPIPITQILPHQPLVLAYITIILATQAPPGVSTYTCAVFVHDFNQNWKSTDFSKNPQYKISRTFALWGLHCSMQTDKANNRFSLLLCMCTFKRTTLWQETAVSIVQGWVQKHPAWHTKAAPNGKCCEGYIAPSVVRLMYQFQYVLK